MGRRSKRPPKKKGSVTRRSSAVDSSDTFEIEGLTNEIVIEGEYTSGPIPGPSMLQRYNESVPGSADILLHEMQLNGRHRRRTESWIALANAVAFVVSNGGAWVIDAGVVAGGVLLLYNDKSIQGFALIIGELVALRWGHKKK